MAKTAPHGRQTREQRADGYFVMYCGLGRKRSLELLRSMVTRLSLNVSLATLKAYSTDYRWGHRVKEYDAQDLADWLLLRDYLGEMNEKHAAIGRLAQKLAKEALDLFEKEGGRLTPLEAMHLGNIGVKIERLAMGATIIRSEIAFRVYSELIVAIADLFHSVNDIEDKGQRWVRFAIGADSLIEAHALGRTPVAVRALPSPRGERNG